MISAALQNAIDNLHIEDVYVRNFVARCEGDFDPKYNADFEALVIQSKHVVQRAQVVELEDKKHLLRVHVDVGTRWFDEKAANEASGVKAFIEAEFIAEYVMTAMLDKASIDEFSLKNVSYHVWPYWRELLASQCVRMNLPKLVLPTVQLAHNRHAVETSSEDDNADKNA